MKIKRSKTAQQDTLEFLITTRRGLLTTVKQVAEGLHVTTSVAAARLSTLIREKKIRHPGRGTYQALVVAEPGPTADKSSTDLRAMIENRLAELRKQRDSIGEQIAALDRALGVL